MQRVALDVCDNLVPRLRDIDLVQVVRAAEQPAQRASVRQRSVGAVAQQVIAVGECAHQMIGWRAAGALRTGASLTDQRLGFV